MSDAQFELNSKDWSFFVAADDLRFKQYFIVNVKSATEVEICDDAETPFGILQNKPNKGEVAMVRVGGISKVRVSSAGLAINTQYGSNSDGRAVARSADKAIVLGQTLHAGTASEDDLATVTVEGGILHTLSV
jgi:hypothetical protein